MWQVNERMCANLRLILRYLIPANIVTYHKTPSKALFHRFPKVSRVYREIVRCLRTGDLRRYDDLLSQREVSFVKQRIYTTMERARDLCMRNLFRKVFILSGRQTRIEVRQFARALDFVGLQSSVSETELHVANMIYKVRMVVPLRYTDRLKGYIKGYISHEKATVVLSAKDAFPLQNYVKRDSA